MTAQANPSKSRLARCAIARAFLEPQGLQAAFESLGFVQADPIRAPARAQDLILRQRVADYRADDLERSYPNLGLEEDFLYAYGFMPKRVWRLVHPRPSVRLDALQKRILDTVREGGAMHPKEFEARFGKSRVINAWGGYSQASKRALESLHHLGYLRIAGREKGIRIYEASDSIREIVSPRERFAELLRIMLRIMAPVSAKVLLAECSYLKYILPKAPERRAALERLTQSGEFAVEVVDGVEYLLPASESLVADTSDVARILAPFDPLVRDRQRFEHLWGWTYRFEAYTPEAKRIRGYYAMPLLWRDEVLGWINAKVVAARLIVVPGFAGKPPKDPAFKPALEQELARFAAFLGLGESDWEIANGA